MTKSAQTVGHSVPRLEGRTKVTGRAEYVHNLRLPGMLYGKISRSTVAHGRIRRIDVTAAQAVAGVHRVLAADQRRRLTIADQRVVFDAHGTNRTRAGYCGFRQRAARGLR